MQLAKAIEADRQRLGLSQAELARLVGVSQQSVSKWEESRSLPRGKRAAQLVHALGRNSQTASALKDRVSSVHHDVHAKGTEEKALILGITAAQSQSEVLRALAQAAEQIARAAQSLAESVERLTEQVTPPSEKH